MLRWGGGSGVVVIVGVLVVVHILQELCYGVTDSGCCAVVADAERLERLTPHIDELGLHGRVIVVRGRTAVRALRSARVAPLVRARNDAAAAAVGVVTTDADPQWRWKAS